MSLACGDVASIAMWRLYGRVRGVRRAVNGTHVVDESCDMMIYSVDAVGSAGLNDPQVR